MSDKGTKPPRKKMKQQVLLGKWLQSGGSKSGAIDVDAIPAASGSHAQGSKGGGGGGSGSDGWAKYEPSRGSYRSGNNIANNNSRGNNSYKSDNASYSKTRGPGAVQTSPRGPAASAGLQRGGTGGGQKRPAVGEAIDLADDDDVGVEKEKAGSGAGGDPGMESAPVPEALKEVLEGLCEEQRHVIDLVLKGKSVFFTGAAGTGKSFLLKKLHQALRLADKGASTFMTGTTGKAAVGIGGCTVHSFAGIGLGKEPVEQLVGRVQRSRNAQKRWAQCKVLVIDEISMMEADLFDKLNLVGQRVKGSSRPFGGIQVVLCGDFFQLPPIGIGRGTTRFCFEAKTWDTAIDQSIVLKQVFRQKDPFFLKILHEMREGRVSPDAQRILADKVEQCRFERYQREANANSAASPPQPAPKSPAAPAADSWGGGDASPPPPASEAGGDEEAIDEGDAGGAPSVSTSASPPPAPPPPPPPSYTRLFSKNEDVDRLNVEELAKLQGQAEFYEATDSGDPTYLNQLQKHCAAGQTIELKVGAKVLLLKNLDSSSQLVNGATGVVTEFVEASGRKLPMVEFDAMEGGATLKTVIREEEWSVSLGDREMARRVQLPLRLAWALSVHKSQGMTISHVMVSTHGMFEFGQAYVALSRATTLDGLHLLDFRVHVVKAHESVKRFYACLERRAAGGGEASAGVTAAPRQGQAPPQPGGWISRRSSASQAPSSTYSGAHGGGRGTAQFDGRGSSGGGSGGGGAGMLPAARARMEDNRRRAMERLAERKRAKALEAASSAVIELEQ